MKEVSSVRILRVMALVALMASPLAVTAQELKVGYVNASQLLEKAPQADAARNNLEKEFAPRDKRLVAEQKELRQMEEKLNRDGAVMSDTERQKMERDIVSRKRDLKRARANFREDLNIRRNEELAKLQKLIVDTIRALAKEGEYDLVLTDAVLYASDKVDITSVVLERLKKGNVKGESQ